MGDFLVAIKEYKLALWQCYGRYLKSFGDMNVDEITTVEGFKAAYFPTGFDTDNLDFTFRALMGKCISTYQVTRLDDPKLQNQESVDKCLAILRFLRLLTQIILPKEKLCWLVYNGTIYMYEICRHLLSVGRGSAALEFLLWACMCMESSVPLLAVRYLTWRATLYTAVCQCYYDCNLGHHGEAFARRAISKVNELSQLESMSNSEQSRDTELIFRHSTVKMAAMVFKRTVFETRRKPKGLLRPKTRANLKDAEKLPWPRTPTEKLLSELVEGSAGQLLLILEALNSSHRRTLITSPPASDADVEILDVYAELFMAAQEIVAGGGGTLSGSNTTGGLRKGSAVPVPGLGGIKVGDHRSLIDMASRGEDGVPITCLVTLAKQAYTYEQWDYFDAFMDLAMTAIKEVNEPQYSPWEKCLELLYAHDKVVPRAKHRKLFATTGDDEDGDRDGEQPPQPSHQPTPGAKDPGAASIGGGGGGGAVGAGVGAGAGGDDTLLLLAEVLLSIVSGPYGVESIDIDMIIDTSLLLWRKCKDVFQKFQTGSTDNPRYLHKMDNPSKWVYVLDIVHQVLGWSGLSAVDPALTAEVVLRLALVFEASASLDPTDKKKSARSMVSNTDGLSTPGSKDSPRRSDSKYTSNSSNKGPSPRPNPLAMTVDARGRDQLLQARDILELGLQNVSLARQMVAQTDGKSVADVGWSKELNPDLFKPVAEVPKEQQAESTTADVVADDVVDGEATSVWNMVKDLHMELLFMYHRVCLKLAQIGADAAAKNPSKATKRQPNSGKPYSPNSTNSQDVYIEKFDELVTYCHKSQLSKSLLYMQKALTFPAASSSTATTGPSSEQKKYLEEAAFMIRKAEQEEKKLYTDNMCIDENADVRPTKIPPAPLLLCRTDSNMVFKPAAFKPTSGQKVAWYRLFCRSAAGSNVKVRLNDYFLPGCGDEVPSFRCELNVSGLNTGEKYVCAVAAYTADGKLIGDSIGESTRPILASHPMPVLMCWAYLCQVAYQAGQYAVAKDACNVLWDQFVAQPPTPTQLTYLRSTDHEDVTLTLHKLNSGVVVLSSPVLLRLALNSLFIHTDINVRQGKLFPDKLCDNGPLTQSQLLRLHECEHLLVALELAGWLNEGNYALQAVVQCYGLLAPLIHNRIPSPPVIQVLERCMAVLQEIPVNLRTKRPHSIVESLNHMIACLTFHLAKVLRGWSQRALATSINDQGRKLLAASTTGGPDTQPAHEAKEVKQEGKEKEKAEEQAGTETTTDTGSLTLAAFKKKRTPRKLKLGPDDGPGFGGGNEELRALEAHMLRISKQAQGDHELSGGEDPSILHAYIAFLPTRISIKEVNKFRRRARYLEFFVQTVQKALSEGNPENALDWCTDTHVWLQRRNEQIMGVKMSIGKQPGAVTVAGDDAKKFAAALVEYAKDKDVTPRGKGNKQQVGSVPSKTKVRRARYKPIGFTPHMTDAERIAQEALEIRAIELLSLRLIELYSSKQRRKKLRKVSQDERPWRSQLNMAQGQAQFGMLLNKMEARERTTGTHGAHIYSTAFLDPEWFEFETAGTLVASWHNPQHKHQQQHQPFSVSSSQEPMNPPIIELAAISTTGKPPPPLFPIIPEEQDTPRTYRSEIDQSPRRSKGKKGPVPKIPSGHTPTDDLTREEAITSLKHTFHYFTRAVVLAHRGGHWTLLQNASRALWNCAHTALLHMIGPDVMADKDGSVPFVGVDTLRSLVTPHFHMAADLLMDMMLQMQQARASSKRKKDKDAASTDPNAPFPVRSVLASVSEERGGAGLKFEAPLDDMTCVDARWFRKLVLRVLEMLYYEHHWEKLVDLALRFNALSDDRYSEQVNPLLVQAQRQLLHRVSSYNGPPAPQPHYKELLQDAKQPLTAKSYSTQQLKLVRGDHTHEIAPGAMMDPSGSDVYSDFDEMEGGLRALQLCSVPLDVENSLLSLRTALSKVKYTARALQHSRKLLVLYLSGQTATMESLLHNQQPKQKAPASVRTVTHVEFDAANASNQSSMPADITKEDFHDPGDVQMCPLPRSQLSIVISSYEKTIELLMASNQKGLAVEAMRELGNIHYHTTNVRAAYKWWCDALDTLLGVADALHKWRGEVEGSKDLSEALLDKCGLWGCLLGAILASNIAQYVLTSDLGLRLESCFLAGFLFKGVFRASLPHPKADKDYALYEVGGEGSEVGQLIPGIDLLSERFRLDGRTLMAALRFVLEDLTHARHNLFVLPLISLYLHFASIVTRDLQSAVWGRILLARALTDLGFYGDALVTLQRLLYGERLPHVADTQSFRQNDARVPPYKFNAGKPILEPINIKAVEGMLDKKLSTALATLYGPHLSCMIALAQAHFLVSLANTIPVLPEFEDLVPARKVVVQPHNISQATRTKLFRKKTIVEQTSEAPGTPKSKDVYDEPKLKGFGTKVDLDKVKGYMLVAADHIAATIADIITTGYLKDKGLCELSACELEVVVLAKVELAVIAQQRHHSIMAARLAHSAITFLRSASIFQSKKQEVPTRKTSAFRNKRSQAQENGEREKKKKRPSQKNEPAQDPAPHLIHQNAQSRTRLDARLWLACRLTLVQAMLGELRGLGQVKGSGTSVECSLGPVRQYCAEGVAEAEAAGDMEMYAEFLMQGALLNLIDGRPISETQQILMDVMAALSSMGRLSVSGKMLQSNSHMLLTDLRAASGDSIEDTCRGYRKLHASLLDQLEMVGEKIECHYDGRRENDTAASPLNNLYLPQLLPLVQAKLRLGHAMAVDGLQALKERPPPPNKPEVWTGALGVLTTALELSRVSALRVASVEAIILLHMGKIQRQLYNMGHYDARTAANTLIEAITTSFTNDHNLNLIRQAYLEVALIYLWSSGAVVLKNDGTILDTSFVADSEDEAADEQKTKKKKYKNKKADKPKSDKKDLPATEKDIERKAAWIAIRCATAVGEAQRARLLLLGQSDITSKPLSQDQIDNLPEFISLDLLHPYVLGERKRIYKDEIEEELAPLTEALEPPPIETYNDELHRVMKAAGDLSWTHILGYQTILQRLCSTSSLLATNPELSSKNNNNDSSNNKNNAPEPLDCPEFNVSSLLLHQSTQLDAAGSAEMGVVRLMGMCEGWAIRLNHLHAYLARNLTKYGAECSAVYPPRALMLNVAPDCQVTDLDIVVKKYYGNVTVPLDAASDATMIPNTPAPGSQDATVRSSAEQHVLTSSEDELCLQWFSPSLEEHWVTDRSSGTVKNTLLLYAISKKKEPEKYHCALMWVSAAQLQQLHDRLGIVTQRAEISLVDDKPKKDVASTSSTTAAAGKGKKQARIKALSPKMKRDEKLEGLLQLCMDDAYNLLGYVPEPPPAPEVAPEETEAIKEEDEQAEGVEKKKKKEQPAAEESPRKPQFPFEVNKTNLYHLQRLFDPSQGLCLQEKKIYAWIMTCFSP